MLRKLDIRKWSRKQQLIGAGAVVLLIAAAVTLSLTVFRQREAAETDQLQTARVRQGDLIIYASGSGTLTAGHQYELGFAASGPIDELDVQAGDTVEAGDVLAVQGEREQLQASVSADQLSVLDAQNALDDLYDNADLVTAQALLDLALKRAKAEYDKYSNTSDTNRAKAIALSQYAAAQNHYNSVLRELNWYKGEPTEIQQAQLDAELAMAKAQVNQAERAYERVKDGPDPDEVEKAQLQLDNAEARLAVSQRNLDESIITAPVDGTVMAVTAESGQTVSGTFITVADLSQLYLEIYLDETDLDKIDLDYEVEVTFDALPDLMYTGHVVQLDPELYSEGPISTVRGLVLLDGEDNPSLDHLLIGMNAAVDVIAGKAIGAVLVPVEALRELSQGKYAVFVLDENGEPRLRTVEVGIMDYTYAEITSGLEVGEVVTSGIVETN
ncbi:MAG: efflux RND transporter periplasmic adaptor subunit [Anaerolineales bacterium]